MPNTDQITHTFSVEWEIAFKSGVSKVTLIDALAAAGLSFVKVVTDCSIPIANSLKKRDIKHHKNILNNKSETKLLITGNLNHFVIKF